MLATIAEFPHPGSIAWLRPAPGRDSAERVRILENDGKRDPLIAFTGLPPRDPALRRIGAFSMPASGNTRVPLAALAASRDEALAPPARQRSKPALKPGAGPKPRRSAR